MHFSEVPDLETVHILLRLTDDIRLGENKRLLTAMILVNFVRHYSVGHATTLSKIYRLLFLHECPNLNCVLSYW